MKLLITGGAGYLGTELVRKLVQDTRISSIIIYDNLSRNNYNLFISHKIPANKLSFIRGDILDSRKLKDTLKDVNIVCHLAARVTTPFSNEDPHFFEQINNWGTAELVNAVENSGVEKLIYMSSTSVYGGTTEEVNENSQPVPDTYYGISKFRGEKHVSRLFDKIQTITLRCGNIYGYSPSMRFDAVINRFMFEAHFFNRISLQGNGTQLRAFIHVDKVVHALSQIIFAKLISGTYNLVDKNLSISGISDTLKNIFPDLEKLYVNQHLNMRSMKVDQDKRLSDFMPENSVELEEELKIFRKHLAFTPPNLTEKV